MQRAKALGISLAVMAGAGAEYAPLPAAAFTPDPRGVTATKFIIADDARFGIFATGKSAFKYDKLTGPYIKTTPEQIEQDYRNNEIAADEKYKGMVIVFSGTINSVSKDFIGNFYITIETGQFLSDIHAEMDEDIATLSKLSKGGKIDLVCKEASYVMASPILHHCRLHDSYLATQEQQAADGVVQWLNGGNPPPFMDTPDKRSMAFVLYLTTTKMPHPEFCTHDAGGNVADCLKQIKAMRPTAAEVKPQMDAARDELGLGAIPPHLPTGHQKPADPPRQAR